MATAVQRASQAASASTTGPQRLLRRSDRSLHITRVDHVHERHAQHVGMHVVESIELIHGSAVLQSTHFDQIHALCDVCATCAASRTIAHSSVWSVSECGGGGLCWRRRRLFSRHHRGQTATADDQSVRWLMCVMHVAMRSRGRVRRIGRARRRRSQLLQGYCKLQYT